MNLFAHFPNGRPSDQCSRRCGPTTPPPFGPRIRDLSTVRRSGPVYDDAVYLGLLEIRQPRKTLHASRFLQVSDAPSNEVICLPIYNDARTAALSGRRERAAVLAS